MKNKKRAYKPEKPDTEIIKVLNMLATGETWDNIEGKTNWSRSSINLARDWYISLSNEDAINYVSRCSYQEDILQWRIGQRLSRRGYRKLQEDSPTEKDHSEDVKDAIRWWLNNLSALPFGELIDLSQTLRFSAWGVVASASPKKGLSRANPIYENHALRNSLQGHLISPAVDANFWDKVGKMPMEGLNFLGWVRGLSQKIENDAIQNTQQPFIQGDFLKEPVTGLTKWYSRTIFERAFGASATLYQGYLRLAVIYGDGGVVLTSIGEGMRLLSKQGWDPQVQTTWAREATDWIEPLNVTHRMLLGEGDWMYTHGTWPLRFVLCVASHEIALTVTLEELEVCRKVHRDMMANVGTYSEVQTINQIRASLDSEAKQIAENLERALLSPSLPGSCPRCHQQ